MRAMDRRHRYNPYPLAANRQLRAILPQDILIEIWQARNSLLCTGNWGLSGVIPTFFNRPPDPGCSIGVVGEDNGTGTLGGYIKVLEHTVDADGVSTPCERVHALTCAHVALGGSPLFEDLKSKGRICYSKDGSLHMQSPSMEDCRKFRKEVESEIATYESDMDSFDIRMNQCQSRNDDRAGERFRALRDLSISNLKASKQRSELVHQDHYLGSVRAAAFGKRAHENNQLRNRVAMDIALIDVTELEIEPEYCYINGRWPFGQKGRDLLFERWETVNLSRRLEQNEEVAKIGQTSGITTGVLHSIKVDLDLSLGKELHTVLVAYVVQNVSTDEYFTKSGDPGSFVFAEACSSADTQPKQHRVIGLLIGGTTNGNFGYFIPFDAVIDEIEALTGGKVIWPVQCD